MIAETIVAAAKRPRITFKRRKRICCISKRRCSYTSSARTSLWLEEMYTYLGKYSESRTCRIRLNRRNPKTLGRTASTKSLETRDWTSGKL